jgi:hypothetical protein
VVATKEEEEQGKKEARKKKKTNWGGGSGESQTLGTIVGSSSSFSNLQGSGTNGGLRALREA